jgi:hypothetical protein
MDKLDSNYVCMYEASVPKLSYPQIEFFPLMISKDDLLVLLKIPSSFFYFYFAN